MKNENKLYKISKNKTYPAGDNGSTSVSLLWVSLSVRCLTASILPNSVNTRKITSFCRIFTVTSSPDRAAEPAVCSEKKTIVNISILFLVADWGKITN